MDIDPGNASDHAQHGAYSVVRINPDNSRFTVIASLSSYAAQRIRNRLVDLHPDRDYCVNAEFVSGDPFRYRN